MNKQKKQTKNLNGIKNTSIVFLFTLFSIFSFAQDGLSETQIDSLEKSFTYQYGTISLKNGIGKLVIPKGFKYLDAEQAERVLVELWGNPKSENLSLGLLMPEADGVMTENSYLFNIQYDEIGFVKDDDADDINYDDLMAQMKEETIEENKLRKTEGYESITLLGWATKPYYDKDKKILYWAKELKFGDSEVKTLNYNVRILGRKGVLVLNAIATSNELPLVQKELSKVLSIFKFNDGYKYEEFDSSIDEVAAWTIGGLVAGKVITKVGFLAIIAKFGKFIVLGLLAFFGGFRNKIMAFFTKKKDKNPNSKYNPDATNAAETTDITNTSDTTNETKE